MTSAVDAIRAKMLPRFVATAGARIARARAALTEDAPAAVREEVHTIAGDAAMIGQPEIADLARDSATHARAWADGDSTAKPRCEAALEALAARLAAI